MNLSEKALQVYQETMEPLMIAINHDAQMVFGRFYEKDELFRMAMSLHLYAISKGKTVKVDPETRMVILE